jgi:hypothetical protein
LNVDRVGQETLVYDRKSDKAYVLSPSAAAVWRACNGRRNVQEIATYLSQDTPTNEHTVWYALGQLQELLDAPVEIPKTHQGISRRQFLKRAGLVGAAAAVPVVVSIVAPSAAHAQSTTGVCCQCDIEPVFIVVPDCEECFSQCSANDNVPFESCGELAPPQCLA